MTGTIIVGIGNPILGDDAVGIHVVRALKEKGVGPDMVIEEAYTGGMNLLDLIIGYDRAILVDSISIPEKEVGDVLVMDPRKMGSSHSANPHDVSFTEALELVQRMGAEGIPKEIALVAVNIEPSFDFSATLSPGVKGAIPKAISEINRLLEPQKR
ncbi:MAG: hydrogenase maturation protease [Candidatus Thermoplasmatota archaeon]|jgi:hydrogenase maturation protease|nr:hydrogenase maturation protease [Candidatus Thermoplasmatota archaeon]